MTRRRKPLTLLRRTWIVPMRCSGDGEEDWGTIPPAHVEVERGALLGGVSELIVMINDRRVLMLERNHPKFREWMSDLISALTEAMDEPCDVPSWAQEHFDEEERRIRDLESGPRFAGGSCFWDSDAEKQNFIDHIPAGAHPVWQPRELDIVWRLPGADVDLRPWRGRPAR